MNDKRKLQSGHFCSLHTLLIICTLVTLSKMSSQNEFKLSLCDKVLFAMQKKDYALLNQTLNVLQEKVYEPCLLELVPKYFWAQNMTHLLLKFQFLNSADTSACSRVLLTNKQVQHSQISLSLICLQSNLLLRYRIKIKTFMPLNFYHAQWRTAEQNSLLLVSPKSPSPYFWKSLYLPNQVPLRKPKIWWKMMQKYKENLANFIYDLQMEQQEEQVSKYVKKRRNLRKHELSQIYKAQSPTYLYCNHNGPFELGSWFS